MPFQKALASPLMGPGLAAFLLLLGCSSTDGPPPPERRCDGIDFAPYKAGAPVSLKDDVMPIFGGSCTLSSCHDKRDRKAGLYLGVRCKTGADSCVFPTLIDPNDTSASPYAPLTDEVLGEVRTSLLAKALTVNSGTVMRVVPGDPASSFLIDKLDGTQADHGACTNQDSSHAVVLPPLPCGDVMPLRSDSLCEGNREGFDAIARWIGQGALAN